MASSDNGEPQTKKAKVVLGEGALFGIGNPLLDLSATADADFLDKYGLEANNQILAEDKHVNMYKEMGEKYQVDYIPGGATQNTLRVAQWILDTPKVATFMGCIGNDDFGKRLADGMEAAHCTARYLVDKETPTGTCACLITGKNRSLCAYLAAANNYKKDHLVEPENWAHVEKAQVMYSAGFHLTVAPDAMIALGEHAAENNKIFCTNLSAPFLSQFFKEPQTKLMPYVDFLFGNETEAAVFAKEQDFGTEDLQEIALKAAALPKKNDKRERVVVITQGAESTIVAQGGKATTYPVTPIAADKIVDTNGAGDAFVGGFLAQLVQGKDIEKCVDCGHYSARFIIQVSGTTMNEKPSYE